MTPLLDPAIAKFIWSIALSIPAFMLGLNWNRFQMDQIIESTITYLVDEGFVKSFVNKDGNRELVRLDDEVKDGKSISQGTDQAD